MYANRITELPPYLFEEIARMREKKMAEGVDVVDLSVGDPDISTPEHIIEELCEAAKLPSSHTYPSYAGLEEFRRAVTGWYHRRFNVDLDPNDQVLTLIGSKEGIVHTPLAFLNPGDPALVPNPAYPPFQIGVKLAGGRPISMPLRRENDFLPDLEELDPKVTANAKLMFINYPNNPTAATATKDFFCKVVEFARENDLIVCHDNAYSEITFGKYKAPSFLEVDGAPEVGVEYNSLSKTYNMTGWRIGYVVGNQEIIKGIGEVKSNIDSGVFEAVQQAAIAALTGPQNVIQRNVEIYRKRRDLMIKGLRELGFEVEMPEATFYVWMPIPEDYRSIEFSKLLLDECGVVCAPGIGFGEHGEGYVRFSLTVDHERLGLAIERMRKIEI